MIPCLTKFDRQRSNEWTSGSSSESSCPWSSVKAPRRIRLRIEVVVVAAQMKQTVKRSNRMIAHYMRGCCDWVCFPLTAMFPFDAVQHLWMSVQIHRHNAKRQKPTDNQHRQPFNENLLFAVVNSNLVCWTLLRVRYLCNILILCRAQVLMAI